MVTAAVETFLPWFRVHSDLTSSATVQALSDFEFRVLVCMHCLAGRSPGADRVEGALTAAPSGEPLTWRHVMYEAWTGDENDVKAALDALESKKLVGRREADGAFILLYRWHQYPSDSSTARTRKHRGRLKAVPEASSSLPDQSTANHITSDHIKGERSLVPLSDGSDVCPDCDGTGVDADGNACKWCDGTGKA